MAESDTITTASTTTTVAEPAAPAAAPEPSSTPAAKEPADSRKSGPAVDAASDFISAVARGDVPDEPEVADKSSKAPVGPDGDAETLAAETGKAAEKPGKVNNAAGEDDTSAASDPLSRFAETFGIPAERMADAARIAAAEIAAMTNSTPAASNAAQTPAPDPDSPAPETPAQASGSEEDEEIAALEDEFGPDSPAVKLLKKQRDQLKAIDNRFAEQSQRQQQEAIANVYRTVVEPFYAELTKDPRLAAVYGVKEPSKAQADARAELLSQAAIYQMTAAKRGKIVSDTAALQFAALGRHADLQAQVADTAKKAQARQDSRDALPNGPSKGMSKKSPDEKVLDHAEAFINANR